jgi:hypothetical protein
MPWLFLFLSFLPLLASSGRTVVIDNVHPRLDTEGNIVNAHDGSLLFDAPSQRFFLYGTHYQACPLVPPPPSPGDCVNYTCGWKGNTFAAYSSPDLTSGSWRLESTSIAPGMAANNTANYYFMPNVLRNAATGTYVLAFNVPNAFISVAVSQQPQGPFTILGAMPLAHKIQSQFDLWMDPRTGLAYARYNAGPGQCIELLNAAFTAGTGNVTCIDVGGFLEGGGVFRRGDLVYVQGGPGCCFCPTGAGSKTYVSSTGPLGNYTYIGDSNPLAPCNVSATADAGAPLPLSPPHTLQPPASCSDLSGVWVGVFVPTCASPTSPLITVTMGAPGGSGGLTFTAHDRDWDRDGNGTLTGQAIAFTGHWGGATATVQGVLGAANGGMAPACTEIRWTSQGHEAERWCREGYCGGGGLAVVAQQFQVFAIDVEGGEQALVYFGERWGSSPTGLKSDDFSVWQPYEFTQGGSIVPFTRMMDNFSLVLPDVVVTGHSESTDIV